MAGENFDLHDDNAKRPRLAMHETLELHELLAMQSNDLVEGKKMAGKVTDPALRKLYLECTQQTESYINDILKLLPARPIMGR